MFNEPGAMPGSFFLHQLTSFLKFRGKSWSHGALRCVLHWERGASIWTMSVARAGRGAPHVRPACFF